MGEITRWRVTRGPQRRVPSDKSLIWLQQTPRIRADTRKRLASIPASVPVDPKAPGAAVPRKATKLLISPYIAYLGVLQDPNNLRSYLKTGTPAGPPSQATPYSQKAAAALMQLDDWLAANAPS